MGRFLYQHFVECEATDTHPRNYPRVGCFVSPCQCKAMTNRGTHFRLRLAGNGTQLMTIRHYKMVLVFSGTAAMIGCLAHGSVGYQSEAPCTDCVQHDSEPVLHYVDQTPEFSQAAPAIVKTTQPRFSVTSNAPPATRSSTISTYSPPTTPALIQNPRTAPALAPQAPVLAPIGEPVFQPIPPEPPALPSETRYRLVPGQKSVRPQPPQYIPVESERKYVPQAASPKGFFQKFGQGFKRMLPTKSAAKPKPAASRTLSRNGRYMSRSGNGTLSRRGNGVATNRDRGMLRRNVPPAPVSVAKEPLEYQPRLGLPKSRVAGPKVLLPVNNPVLLQRPEPVERTQPRPSIATAQKSSGPRKNHFPPPAELPIVRSDPSGYAGIEMWPYRPGQRRKETTAFGSRHQTP